MKKFKDKEQSVLDRLLNIETNKMCELRQEITRLNERYAEQELAERRRIIRQELAAARARGVRNIITRK